MIPRLELFGTRDAVDVSDLRERARKRLPAPAFEYLDGGADDELTLARNQDVFQTIGLMPRMLRDVSRIETQTELLGRAAPFPLMLSPTGLNRLFHHRAETAVAKAASSMGVPYSLSTMGTTSIEHIGSICASPKIFQLYIFKDRALTTSLLTRAEAAGYDAICLTVDTPIAGNRKRDHRTGMTIPPRITARSLVQYALRPEWSLRTLLGPAFTLPNVEDHVGAVSDNPMSLISYVNEQFDRTLSWDSFRWLRDKWKGKLIIKGLLSVDDCVEARANGADCIMLSNHGGRQLDSAPSPIDVLPMIREELGDDIELVVDGGIRTGSDIFKAIALGATACSIGRTYLFGLAANGQSGVTAALSILRNEFERTMALTGVASVDQITAECLFAPTRPRDFASHAAWKAQG